MGIATGLELEIDPSLGCQTGYSLPHSSQNIHIDLASWQGPDESIVGKGLYASHGAVDKVRKLIHIGFVETSLCDPGRAEAHTGCQGCLGIAWDSVLVGHNARQVEDADCRLTPDGIAGVYRNGLEIKQ